MFYDYDYTLFFQRALQQVMGKIKPDPKPLKMIMPVGNSYNIEGTQQLLQQLKEKDTLILELQTKIVKYEKELANNGSLQTVLEKLKEEIDELKAKIKRVKQDKRNLNEKLTLANQKELNLERQVLELVERQKQDEETKNANLLILQSKIEKLQKKLDEKDSVYAKLGQEQEELYVVLAEKSIEIKNLKKQLGLPDEEESAGDDDGEQDDVNNIN